MGSRRSKSCRASSLTSTAREDLEPPPSGGGGRRRKPMSLLCSLHSFCLASSSSTSHDSDDGVDEQVSFSSLMLSILIYKTNLKLGQIDRVFISPGM